MNSSILVSHCIEKGNWNGAADKLNEFWRYVSVNPNIQNFPGFNIWWNNWHNINPTIASEESARRYFCTKEFLVTGVPNVFSPLIPRPDTKFFDVQNTWYIYNNQPLKYSLENFARFPIATNFDQNQPRLLLVSVDVMEGSAVTFDSYPKDIEGVKRFSEYGVEIKKGDDTQFNKEQQCEFVIEYDKGITSDHAIASGSVQINYDYSILDSNRLTIDNDGKDHIENVQRYFWDGGIFSNTPLRELTQAHKDYWLDIRGEGKEDSLIPDLDVYIVDVWPTKETEIPLDHDSVVDRYYDLLLNDKTDYDEKVVNIVSDYIGLVTDLINLAKNNNIPEKEIKKVLSTPAKSSHRSGKQRTYQNLIEGRFEINVNKIERMSNINFDISNKIFDYSFDTINQLINDGYSDTMNRFKK